MRGCYFLRRLSYEVSRFSPRFVARFLRKIMTTMISYAFSPQMMTIMARKKRFYLQVTRKIDIYEKFFIRTLIAQLASYFFRWPAKFIEKVSSLLYTHEGDGKV